VRFDFATPKIPLAFVTPDNRPIRLNASHRLAAAEEKDCRRSRRQQQAHGGRYYRYSFCP